MAIEYFPASEQLFKAYHFFSDVSSRSVLLSAASWGQFNKYMGRKRIFFLIIDDRSIAQMTIQHLQRVYICLIIVIIFVPGEVV